MNEIKPAPSPSPPASAAKSYDLYYVIRGKRFFWRNPNHGITIIDEGRNSALTWLDEGRECRGRWLDIAGVNLMLASDGKANVNQCEIRFSNGECITVTDTGAAGTLEEDRTPVYRDFVRALNARLAMAPQGTIAFTAGVSEGKYLGLKIVFGIAAAFFVALPFVLLFIVRDWKVLGTLAAGAAFIWPFWKAVQHGRPRTYEPKYPPEELME